MRNIYNYILIVISFFLISACNNKKQSQEEQKKQINEVYNEIEKLQEKAEQDSDYTKSKEYLSQMEKAAIEMSKNTYSMPENEKLLLEYEVSLKNLKKNTDSLKLNNKLSYNKYFINNTRIKADKVRECQQKLLKANLNHLEKEKFTRLSHQ